MTTPVDDATRAALARVVAPLGPLADVARLTGGMFATTHRVTLADGTRVVVKAAPSGTSTLLTYEHDLIRSEAHVYARVADRPDLLMPRLLLLDTSRTDLPGDALVATHLDGVPWQDAGFGSAAEDVRAARAQRDLGAFMARLHTVTGDRFGYVGAVAAAGGPADPPGTRLHGTTWPATFGRMVEAVLGDAERWGVDVRAADVRGALTRHADALAQVTTPTLVHGDLWPGNLFVAADGALVGVIDPERALWGDPLMELVGADQVGSGPVAPGLRAGYEQVAPLDLESPDARVRLRLYRLYTSAILHVECVPRAYAGEFGDWYRRTSGELLHRALDELAAA